MRFSYYRVWISLVFSILLDSDQVVYSLAPE